MVTEMKNLGIDGHYRPDTEKENRGVAKLMSYFVMVPLFR